ncbi:ImmA/IrrE family metallo-endopeptidase [candidate division KSB1 bacterium]
MTGQVNLFRVMQSSRRKKEICALDEMFKSSRRYRSSSEYMQLLNFICKFRKYAPFNCALLHFQNTDISYIASAADWYRRFNRIPKRNARPLVILQPFGPVMFVYDVLDTEGDPLPDYVIKPFNTRGYLNRKDYDRTIYNCTIQGIDVRDDIQGLFKAGKAIRLNPSTRDYYKDLKLSSDSSFLILLNKEHSIKEKYSTLSHELGHIFCGHLGTDKISWWPDNDEISHDIQEIEAESVAYLVCLRMGLNVISDRYLSKYKVPEDVKMPVFSINAVFQSVDYIEQMGRSRWKEPKRKPRKSKSKQEFNVADR